MKGYRFATRITLLRAAMVDDGLQTIPGVPVAIGTVWAARRDISDGERLKGGEKAAELVARFVIRATAFSRTLTAKDCLREAADGPVLEIFGVKSMHEGQLIEITTMQRSDR